jgi:imidazolonepropionase-like amidohydrolase
MNASHETGFVRDYQPDANARVELKNGRFVDAEGGCYLAPGTSVTIKDGKIESVGDSSAAPAPDFTVDLQGKAVYPGLFNTHCHIAMTLPTGSATLKDVRLAKKHHDEQITKNMAECLAHGVTTIRDAWTTDLNHNRSIKKRISSEEMPGPRIIQSVLVGPLGGYLSEDHKPIVRFIQKFILGVSPVDYDKSNSGSVVFPKDAGEQQVRDAVDRAVDERGAECIKIGEQLENMVNFKPDMSIMTIEQLKALTDQANKRGMRTTIHHVSIETFRRAQNAGVSSLAHAAFNALLTEVDIEAFVSANCIIEPTVTVAYDVCWKIKDDPFCDHPEMERLTRFREETFEDLMSEYWLPKMAERVMGGYHRLSNGKMKALGIISTANIYKYYSGTVAEGTENIRALFNAGACLACGTDGGVPASTPGMVQHELKMLAFVINGDSGDGKFTSAEALRIATINSALALGMDDKLGSIETGKIADLVIVDGDPLEDLDVIGSRAAALFLDGKLSINNCGLHVEAKGN